MPIAPRHKAQSFVTSGRSRVVVLRRSRKTRPPLTAECGLVILGGQMSPLPQPFIEGQLVFVRLRFAFLYRRMEQTVEHLGSRGRLSYLKALLLLPTLYAIDDLRYSCTTADHNPLATNAEYLEHSPVPSLTSAGLARQSD